MTKRVRVRLSHSHCRQIDSATQRHQCDWDHVTVRLRIKQCDSRNSLKHGHQCVTVPSSHHQAGTNGRAISFTNLSPDVPRVPLYA
jgi:hypothetical protein